MCGTTSPREEKGLGDEEVRPTCESNLSCTPNGGGVSQPERQGQRLVVGHDHLNGDVPRCIEQDRALEIGCQRHATFAHNTQDVELVLGSQVERFHLTLVDVCSIIGCESPRADDGQRNIGQRHRLQPSHLFIVFAGQQYPMPTGFKANQTMRHQQHVRVVYFHFSETRRLDLHDFTGRLNSANVLQSVLSANSR